MIRLTIFLICCLLIPAQAVAAERPAEFDKAYQAYTELMKQDEVRDAIPYAKVALDIALRSDGFNDEDRARLAFNLGYAYFQDGRLTASAEAFTEALGLLEKYGARTNDLRADAFVYRGICYRHLLKPDLAERDLKQAVELLTDQNPTVQIVRADALENLAWVMIQKRRSRSAHLFASQAHNIYSRLLPKRHPRTLRVLVLVAASTYLKGNSGEARDILARAIGDAEKVGVVPEGSNKKTDPTQFTLRELIRFHRDVARFYELMERQTEADYHNKVASDLYDGIRPGALRVKAISRTPPSYPRRAAERGKIGWVIVEFTVRKDGSTSDIRVIDAAPEGYFENAALNAAKSWKYQPPVENGKPADVTGVRTVIQFILKK